MSPQTKRAARLAPEAARDTAVDISNDTDLAAISQAGKALAVWLYSNITHDLTSTAAMFARHPEWAAA